MNDDAKPIKEEIQMYNDAKSMKAEVPKKVPIGSSIQDAKQVMEENGFRCAMYNNDGFVEIQEAPPEDPSYMTMQIFFSVIKRKYKQYLL